ncbi:MAG TPA: Uma2 family endonuclease, partial [Pyrinomonadaceae bacterium]|nr:Uma2 family endonuclease [Pyrinomonadaceae bacterium]
MSTTTALMTAEELLRLPRGQFRYELINGELKKMSPTGHEHGRITMRLAAPLAQYVKAAQLGEVYAAETGFKLRTDPDTVRAPDVAFICKQRVVEVGSTKGYWHGAPDLAVEVLSPDDRAAKVKDKVSDWLLAGAKQVWVVSPKLRRITVYRSMTDITVLTEKETLHSADLIPGFTLPLREIF